MVEILYAVEHRLSLLFDASHDVLQKADRCPDLTVVAEVCGGLLGCVVCAPCSHELQCASLCLASAQLRAICVAQCPLITAERFLKGEHVSVHSDGVLTVTDSF